MKFKTFSATSVGDLENKVNDWLAANPGIRIVHATQSEAGTFPNDWAITFSIVYER